MKSTFLLAMIAVFFLSGCSDRDDDITPGLTGTWQLAQVFYDPGDGSGDFRPVESNKTITFLEDGTVVSNGALCNLSENSGEESSATYDTELAEIYVPDCQGNLQVVTVIRYTLEGNYLDLYYQCIEPCAHRFVKVGD